MEWGDYADTGHNTPYKKEEEWDQGTNFKRLLWAAMKLKDDQLMNKMKLTGKRQGNGKPLPPYFTISRTTLPTPCFQTEASFRFVVPRIYLYVCVHTCMCFATQARVICYSRINTKAFGIFLL